MARPPLPPGQAVSVPLSLRLTVAEHAALEAIVASDNASAASRGDFATSSPAKVLRGLLVREAQRRGLLPAMTGAPLVEASVSPAALPAPPAPAPAPVARSSKALKPMPSADAMRAQLEALLESTPDLRAKDVAQGAGLSPQDVSAFRQGRNLIDEKRSKLWAWLSE